MERIITMYGIEIDKQYLSNVMDRYCETHGPTNRKYIENCLYINSKYENPVLHELHIHLSSINDTRIKLFIREDVTDPSLYIGAYIQQTGTFNGLRTYIPNNPDILDSVNFRYIHINETIDTSIYDPILHNIVDLFDSQFIRQAVPTMMEIRDTRTLHDFDLLFNRRNIPDCKKIELMIEYLGF